MVVHLEKQENGHALGETLLMSICNIANTFISENWYTHISYLDHF